jgi:hypothetical protein
MKEKRHQNSAKPTAQRQSNNNNNNNNNDSDERIEIDVDQNQNQTPEMSTNLDISTLFNNLVTSLINIYDKYTDRQMENEDDDEDDDAAATSSVIDDCVGQIEKLNINQLNELPKSKLFKYFVNLMDKLTQLVLILKRDHFHSFFNFFKHTNLVIVQFYEFVNRILNVFNDIRRSGYSSGHQQMNGENTNGRNFASFDSSKKGENMHDKTFIIEKVFELIHALIASMNTS